MSYIADVKYHTVGALKLCDDLGLPNHKNTEKKNKKHILLSLTQAARVINFCSVGSYFQTIKNTLKMVRLKNTKSLKKPMKISKIGF